MRRLLVVAVTIASLATATSLNPSVAVAMMPDAQGGGAVSVACASPPDLPEATVENRDEFVGLWLARLQDDAWLKSWTAATEVTAEVKAEGFHDMDPQVQLWLNACLVDAMMEVAGETPGPEQFNKYLAGLNMIIFGKDGLKKMREELNAPVEPDGSKLLPTEADKTAKSLADMTADLIDEPSLLSADHPKVNAPTPETTPSGNAAVPATPELKSFMSSPAPTTTSSGPQAQSLQTSTAPGLEPHPITALPLVPAILEAISELLQVVATIQQQLFTLPVLNLLASAFYRICAESPTMPLRCSVLLPIGIPIPADVTGDNVPDVTGWLGAFTNLKDVSAKFQVQRLNPQGGALPAHVFAVYDTPIVKKRIEFGVDGRASTLGATAEAVFTLVNAVQALTGDVQVKADLFNREPGSTQALTFAVKDLVGGSPGVLPTEANPLTGAVQMSPFPQYFTVNARFTHTNAKSQDTFKVESATPSRVDAVVDQRTTTTPQQSSRRFTATVDKLPTSVLVDLVRQGEHQSIDYTASAPISLVRASDTTTLDVSHPGSFTESIYEVKGVPTSIGVDLVGAQDITYTANAKIPEVSFSTQTQVDSVLQQQITAKAHQIPESVHVVHLTNDVEQRVTYSANDKLADVELGMYDLDENGIETDLKATATGIPKEIEFVATQETGAYDFTSDTGIDLIEATLTRNGGMLLPMPGKDHATIYKRGEEMGLDFRLSGFTSAHFDGHEETDVALGLSPGGQTFDVIADIDDSADGGPNVLATAHIGALPANMAVSFDPENGTATYNASSVIPLLEASFTDRDSEMFGNAKLTDLPKTIGLTFNTEGEVPEITYDADSRLGSIEMNYSEKPGGLALHGLISDLPQYMRIGGIDPMVFDARTSAAAAPASSDIGQILFQYATDGVFASPPTTDDHVYLDTDEVDTTHAELLYSGLRFISVDTSNSELHATIKNTADRLFRAYLTTPNLTMTGYIDKVPSEITVSQVGNLITYDASATINEIATDVERSNGDTLAVLIQDVPQHIEMLFDGEGAKLDWSASSVTGLVSAVAHLTPDTLGGTRNFDAGLTITDIPTQWDATWADGNVLFQAGAPGIGGIAARVTNHGVFHVLPGDHLTAYYREGSGDLDAGLKISNLTKAGFTKLTGANGGGFVADLNMGNQGSFDFAADVVLNAGVLKANGGFDHLPSTINLKSDGGRITYTGNSNPDLTLSVESGQSQAALNNTPAAPSIHGVSVRDGASGADKAVKAKLYLTGLPNSLDLNSPAGTYQVNGYHPTIATLSVDVKLTQLAPKPVDLQLSQGVPTASPVNFTFGPFLSSTAGDGTHSLSLNYTANQELGALDATVIYGNTDEATLHISSIPASISVNAGFGADTKTIGIAMSHGIDEIRASYKDPDMLNLAASVKLTDVPSSVNIVLGKESGSGSGTDVDAPVFQMHNSSAGLDIEAAATAEIADPVDANAAVSLNVTNLGKDVTGDLIGNRLHITSAPATGGFTIQAAGRVQKNVNLDWDGGIFQNDGELDIDLKIHKITLGLTAFSDVNVRLGFTTGLDGTFGSFTLGQDSNLNIKLRDHFYVHIDWPDPFGSDDITLINIPTVNVNLGNVVPRWHINRNVYGEIFHIPFFFFVLGECSVVFDARPAPGYTTPGSTFTVGPSPAGTPAWLLTPDISLLGISLPDFALDIIAFFGSPYGHDINAHPDCYTYL